MRTVVSAQQMRDVDKYMIETLRIPGIVLMENAAMGTARLVMEKHKEPCVVHVFCGTGNNGGDGLACARILLARGYDAYVAIVGDAAGMSEDATTNYAFFEHFKDRVLHVSAIEDLYSWRVPKADVIVDALFGTGLKREVLGVHADVIASMNSAQALRVSVDIPSGIDADTGRVLGCAVQADCTATFQYPKIGHYLYPGREYTGELRVVPIGVDKGVEDVITSHMVAYESDDPDILVPVRKANSNKGTYGRLLLLAGSRGMAGAAVMSAKSAYAAGAGLVTVGAPWAVIDVMQNAVPEATCDLLPEEEGQLYHGSTQAVERSAQGKTAIALGPGLGSGRGLKALVSEILTTYNVCRIVDADALNALDKDLKVLAHIRGEVVFTPHPLEFARLLGTELHSVLDHPLELATAFAQKCRVTLVLKGATTIVAGPDGEISFIAAGTPGMAKGGSGDVLTGAIAGLATQGVPGYDAAVLGTYLCAMAGEKAALEYGEYSMTPEDTIRCLGDVMEGCISPDAEPWELPEETQSHHRAAPQPRETAGIGTVRTSAQRIPQKPANLSPEPKQSVQKPSQPAQPAVSVESVPESAAADTVAVRDALNALSQPDHEAEVRPAQHTPEKRESTTAPGDSVPAAATISEEKSAKPTEKPEAHEKHDTSHHSSHHHHSRMSATDIRPPRIPTPRQDAESPHGTTKNVKPVDTTMSTADAAAAEAEAHSRAAAAAAVGVKPRAAQPRAEHQSEPAAAEHDKQRGRKLEGTPEPTANPVEDIGAEEEKKRERLNNEIQQELTKKKASARTRRRIG